MTEFKPPMSERETEDLVEIVYSPEHWKKEAVNHAKKELKKRGVSENDQLEILDKSYKEFEKKLKAEKDRLESNKTASYTYLEMASIFIFGPLSLIRRIDPIFYLKNENYYLKFKQRVILLISGSVCWFLFIYISFQKDQKERLEEIDKIDISEWRKTHG